MRRWSGERTGLSGGILYAISFGVGKCFGNASGLIASFTNCLHRSDKCGVAVGDDEGAIRVCDRAIFTPSVTEREWGTGVSTAGGGRAGFIFFVVGC
jgi:hypothetical protein